MVPVAALFFFGAGIRLEKSVFSADKDLTGSVEDISGEEELVWEDPEGAAILRLRARTGKFSFPLARAWSRENVLRLGSVARTSFLVRLDPLFSGVEAIWEEDGGVGGGWRASSGRGQRALSGPLVRSDEFLPSREEMDEAMRRFRLARTHEALVRTPCLSSPDLLERLRSVARRRAEADAWGTILFEEFGFLPAGVRADVCFCHDCIRACSARRLPPPSTLDEARKEGNLQGWSAHRLFMSSLPAGLKLGSFREPGALGVELCSAYSILPYCLGRFSWCAFKETLSAWLASGLVPGLKVVAPSREGWEPGFHGFLGRNGFLPRGLRSYLARAEVVWDGTAMVYSHESVLASYVLDASRASLPFRPAAPFKETWKKALSSWLLLLRDCSLDPRAVMPDGVPTSGLLVLPRTCAVSDAACRSVRAFARRGGTVVADCMTALYDERCRERPRGGLDDLFGIEQKNPKAAELSGRVYSLGVGRLKWQETADPAVLLRRGKLGGLSPAEKGVFLRGGGAAASARGTHAFIARREGKGLAAFLNVRVTLYPEMRKRPEGKLLRAVVRALAAEAGVRPRARVLGRERGPRVRTLEWGGSFLVWMKGEALGGSRVELDCPFVPCVYDALTGEFLGRSHTIVLSEGPEERYLSLLPGRVSLALSPLSQGGRAFRGGEFSFELTVKGSKANHVVELRLYDPFGRELAQRRRLLIVKGGRCEFPVYFALNDPPGLWKIEVIDALTRRTGSTRLVVE